MKAIQLLLSLRVIPCFAGRTPPQQRHPHTCQETKPCPDRQNLCQKLGMNERHGVLNIGGLFPKRESQTILGEAEDKRCQLFEP